MKFKYVVALGLAALAQGALADDQTVTFSGLSAAFDNVGTALAGGDDVITFAGLAPGAYNFDVGVTGLNTFFQSTSDLNGVAGTVTPLGNKITFVGVIGAASTPLVLTLRGTTSLTGVKSYTGLIEVSPVPEPGTYAMLLAGLAAVGFVAKRRSA